MKNEKMIRVSHLVYIIIIAVIVLSYFLVFALGDRESASTTIGTASTVSSLILSVIAIVMTLIDVAGQKQSMVDLKETADKLKKSNKSAADLTKSLIVKIDGLETLRVHMTEEMEQLKNHFIEQLKELKEKGTLDEIDNLVAELDKKPTKRIVLNEYYNFLAENQNLYNSILDDEKVRDVIAMLRNDFSNSSSISESDFLKVLYSYFPFERAEMIYKALIAEGYIALQKTENDIYIRLRPKFFRK